jgi:hypothetical protein
MTKMDYRIIALKCEYPSVFPHMEAWSCPDAETYITGINYYQHPRLCRIKMNQIYPNLYLQIPKEDKPIEEPKLNLKEKSVFIDENGKKYVRWGDGKTTHWEWGKKFKTEEDVFSFSPLQKADFSDMDVVESRDYSSEENLYQEYIKMDFGEIKAVGFYNTMFMWPLLTFGWELFLLTCLDKRFERIMKEFAEINRRVFRVFSRLPVDFVFCHDDICNTRGPICSPEWMNKYIYPYYEEFWDILKKSGKRVIFISDGCLDAVIDNIFSCGADGIIAEPHTDFKKIAKKYPSKFLAGEGDNRILYRGNEEEIKNMVKSMVETGKMVAGYAMCIGNHIPWNLSPRSVKLYLDLCKEMAHR